MKKWVVPLLICLIFLTLTVIFLTPSLTAMCTDDLLICLEDAKRLSFGAKLVHHLGCVFHNVICVLGWLFV